MKHIIVVSIELFGAQHTGMAPLRRDVWLRAAGIALRSNLVGGVVLVTGLRILQAGREGVDLERARGKHHVLSSPRAE